MAARLCGGAAGTAQNVRLGMLGGQGDLRRGRTALSHRPAVGGLPFRAWQRPCGGSADSRSSSEFEARRAALRSVPLCIQPWAWEGVRWITDERKAFSCGADLC